MDDELIAAFATMAEDRVLTLVRARMEARVPALVIAEACREGMTLIGQRFQRGDCYLPELLLSAALFKRVMVLVEPALRGSAASARAAVVVGSVKGDIHDLGKGLVVTLLRAAGYEVHDLGVNVPPRRFVDSVRETGATVLGLSALLTTSFVPLRETVAAVDAAGLRPRVRIMIGGGPINDKAREFTGADAWGADAPSAVTLCNRWTEAKR